MTVLLISMDFLQKAHTIKYVFKNDWAYVAVNRDRIMLNPIAHVRLSYEDYLRIKLDYSKMLIKIMSEKGHTPSGILVST